MSFGFNKGGSGFNMTHFQGGGNNSKNFGGSFGANYTTPQNNFGSSATFGAERHGQTFGRHNQTIGSATFNQQHLPNVNSYVGASVGSNGAGNTIKAGLKIDL
jgi:hypothetical protein